MKLRRQNDRGADRSMNRRQEMMPASDQGLCFQTTLRFKIRRRRVGRALYFSAQRLLAELPGFRQLRPHSELSASNVLCCGCVPSRWIEGRARA